MGIKNLSDFLKKGYPQIFESIHISDFAYKKVAIDTSLYMCAYKANYGEKDWLGAFIKLVAMLRENEVHPVFIFDSGCPPEKEHERKERRDAREKQNIRVSKLEDAIDKYEDTNEIDPILFEFQEKRKINSGSLLRGKGINIHAIKFYVQKMRNQLFEIKPEDFETVKSMLSLLDIPTFQAPLEAETTCADLCVQGKVDAVLSEDTDVLAYSCPVFITKINTKDGSCTKILHENVLRETGLSKESFLDFCIMSGTDYNKNIEKIGSVRAFRLIKENLSIENVRDKAKINVTKLNHVRVREIFQNYKKFTENIPYVGAPDFSEFEKFLEDKKVSIEIDSLKKSFLHNSRIIFEE